MCFFILISNYIRSKRTLCVFHVFPTDPYFYPPTLTFLSMKTECTQNIGAVFALESG